MATTLKSGINRYLTEYPNGGTTYGADIYATSWNEAKRFARQRRIGEVVLGEVRKRGGLRKPVTRIEKLHEAIYLGWIAMEMGKMSANELLGDRGLIHEMVHGLVGVKTPDVESRFRKLQRMIPGHRP